MPRNIDDFWKILQEIQGTTTDLTTPVKAIAKNEQAVSENFINNVIDQMAHRSSDWYRIKNFIRDWYASHRTIASYQNNISDIFELPNDQLDELFRSFGYPYSTFIKDSSSNEAPTTKVNFFLDLVNLYKRKGTPQALLDVFRYHGISQLDIYEFQLQLEERYQKDPTDLIFKGTLTTGTSGNSSPIYLPFNFLTESDPHWFQTEQQIRDLLATNKINFPSTTPYLAVKPVFDEESIDAATGILSRKIQDQHDLWEINGSPDEAVLVVLPQDAVITVLAEVSSLLTLYLSAIYLFNKEFYVGSAASRFICYDGTNVSSVDIMEEFSDITQEKILTRLEWREKWELYLDTFSRIISRNFLQDSNDASLVLDNLNPTIKTGLDNLTIDNIEILGTLLTDLGEWLRNNVSFGFINMSYILFGLDSLFSEMSKVVEFFKPYRARLIPIEQLEFSNRLFNTIIVEDTFATIDVDERIYDFVTGDSIPCCSNLGIDSTSQPSICLDSTTNLYYSRETFDCGSWFDIGAVTDLPENEFIEVRDDVIDRLGCPIFYGDGTAAIQIASRLDAPNAPIVNSELIENTFRRYDIQKIEHDADTVTGEYREVQSAGYALTLNLFNEIDSTSNFYSHVITNKTINDYTAKISGLTDTVNYFMSCDYDNSVNSGIVHIPDGTNTVVVSIPTQVIDNTAYTVAISLSNLVDSTASTYYYAVTERTTTTFTVEFSDNMNSNNYYLEWILITHDKQGVIDLPITTTTLTIPFLPPYEVNDNYGLSLSLLNEVDSTPIIPLIVTDKRIDGFTVKFSQVIDTNNYQLMWSRPLNSSLVSDTYNYRQTGSFINFDGVPLDSTGVVYVEGTQGHFDCDHGKDIVEIEVYDTISFLLQQNGSFLLQEDGSNIVI